MTKLIKSPLRYPGGKYRARKEILSYFPDGITKVVSPFMGGGNIEINLANQGIKVHASDKFAPLVFCWHLINNHPVEFATLIQKHYPLSKANFYREQKRFSELLDGKDFLEIRLKLATWFFILNRSSHSGTTLSGRCYSQSDGFTQSSIDYVRNWQKLDKLNVNYADFKESLIHNRDAFVFADPPYMVESNLYGNKGDLHKDFDHQGLFELLNKRDGWILCYNDCPTIREMYSRFKIIEPKWSYGMGNDKKSRELLILNY
jgi:DNA adenine methylase